MERSEFVTGPHERQGAYVRMLGLGTPYARNHRRQFKRSEDRRRTRGLKEHSARGGNTKVPVHTTGVTLDSGNPDILRAYVDAEPTTLKHATDVYVAIAFDHAESSVLHGEDGGRQ